MTRTDVHRIAVLDPADYRLVALQDMHEEDGSYEALDDRYMDPESVFELLDGDAWKCRVCGNNHGNRYWAFFEHEPSGEVIQVGSQCAAKVNLGSRSELEQVRAHEGRRMAQERGRFLAGNPAARQALENAMRIVADRRLALRQDGVTFILNDIDGEAQSGFITEFSRDLVGYFNRNAYLSDKQIYAALRIPEWVAQEEERARKQAEREAAKRPVPTELTETRGEISGEVVSVKWHDSRFGGAFKMTIRDDRGFAVWGTVPTALEDAFHDDYHDLTPEERDEGLYSYLKGKRVRFDAKVEISDDDECFGFFKRPTKAKIC